MNKVLTPTFTRDILNSMYQLLNDFVISIESKFGRIPAIIIIALLSIIVASIYVRPDFNVAHLGFDYANMAENPLSAPQWRVGYRILTPLISWVLGLHGKLIIITNLLFATILIGVVFRYFRLQYPKRPGDAIIASSVITFSMVTLCSIYYGGYTDSLTYLIIFLMWQFRRRIKLFYFLLLLGMFNRESIAFLIPWFLYIQHSEWKDRKIWLTDSLLWLTLIFVTYGMWRIYMSSIGVHYFNLAYYFEPMADDPFYWIKQAFPFQSLGLYSVFKILWVIPLLAVYNFFKKKEYSQIIPYGLILFGVGAQLIIAIDSSRMWTLGFMVIILSLNHLFESDKYNFRSWGVWLLIGNLMVPQIYTAAQIVQIMFSTPANLIMVLLKSKSW